MDQISRFIVWLCSKFNREQLEFINKELSDILQGRKEFPVNPKDAFREKHPNYRDFHVDPSAPLTEPAKKKPKIQTLKSFLKLIKPSTAGGSNPSRFKTGNQSPKPNNALFATHRINICIITMAKNDPNYSARSAHRLLTPIIVIKERSKPNTSARTANMPYSAGKPFCTSLFTNAAMITALTALMPSTNSTQRKNSYKKRNLLNSSSATYTANIYSKLQNLFTPARSSLSSTSKESTILKTSSD